MIKPIREIKYFLKEKLIDFFFKEVFKTTDGISFNKMFYRILSEVEKYNEKLFPLEALLCEYHDEGYIKFDTSNWLLKPLGEGESARAPKIVWGKRQRDADKFGLNIGYTSDWLFSEMASSENIMQMVEKAEMQDEALKTVKILEACFSDSYGFYNGNFSAMEKIDRPPSYGAKIFEKNHNHYLALDIKKISLNEIENALEHIKHHGYGRKDKEFFLFCNHGMKKKIGYINLHHFGEHKPRSKKIRNISIGEIFTRDEDVISVFECEWLPDKYFLLLYSSERVKPLRMIEKRNPAARGLILESGPRDRSPLRESAFLHWLNFLVFERGAGVVLYLGKKYKTPEVLKNINEHDKADC